MHNLLTYFASSTYRSRKTYVGQWNTATSSIDKSLDS